MNTQIVDVLARSTRAFQDRRTALKTLAVTALVPAAATPFVTEAKKAAKRARRKARKEAELKCQLQVPTCEVSLSAVCQPGPGVQECLDNTSECCELLGSCDAAAAMACVVTKFIVQQARSGG